MVSKTQRNEPLFKESGESRLFNPVFKTWDEVWAIKKQFVIDKPKGYVRMLHARERGEGVN